MYALTIADLSTLRHFFLIFHPKTLTPIPQFPNPFLCSHFGASPMASSKVVAEYAKSSRSSCKKCSKTISAKDLRLGIVSKHPRGFDTTSWHHLDCFPMDSESACSVEAIKGLSALENNDQEAVKRTVGRCHKSTKDARIHKLDGHDEQAKEMGSMEAKIHKLDEREEDIKERISKKTKIHKLDEREEDIKERISKKTKTEEAKLDFAFSVSDIKDSYKDAKLLPKWKAFETIIFLERDDGLNDSRKIAAFDFDGCLAKTSVKRIGADAWSLMYKSIPDKFQSLYNDGYKLVIFTNESNIERWKNKRQVAVDSKIGRLNNFIKRVKVPIQVFIACGTGSGQVEDLFRKPQPGMWRIMEQHFNSGISIDMDQSFYVGDAAGRPNDHSDSDIKFAEAVGLKFYVPEEYFSA